jgi:uncharacterized membrane protein
MRLFKWLRNSFLAGLVLVLPLIVTLVAFRIVFGWTIGFIDPIVTALGLQRLFADVRLAAQLATIGVILVAVTLVGYVARLNVGGRALGEICRFVNFIPVFRTVYGSVKQVASSFSERSETYDRVVYVQSPWEDVYSIGFVTGDGPADLGDQVEEAVYNVYQPASPNPTNGRLLLVPESRMEEAEMSVRQAIRLVMTTGVAATSEELERAADRDGVAIDLPGEGA